MSVTVQCPKCESNAQVVLIRHQFIYGKSDTEMRCMFCGARRYGAEAERLVEQANAHRAAAEAERLVREQAEAERLVREREEAERATRERAASAPSKNENENEQKTVDVTVAPRANQPSPAQQARADAPRLRRERLAAARAAAVAERGEDAVCASPLCANPRPPERRYCGKKCSDDVARDRHKAKKVAEGPTT